MKEPYYDYNQFNDSSWFETKVIRFFESMGIMKENEAKGPVAMHINFSCPADIKKGSNIAITLNPVLGSLRIDVNGVTVKELSVKKTVRDYIH